MKTAALILFGILGVIVLPCLLFGDVRLSGEISGTVVSEDDQPVPGVSVDLQGEQLIQGSVLQTTNEKGFFRFTNIKPGNYVVTFSLQGFATKKYDVLAEVGRAQVIRAVMQPAALAEEVQVTDNVPLIDPSSPQISSNYTEEIVQRIPTRREFIDFMDLVPGITDRGAYGEGGIDETKYSRGSATSTYRLNGVDVSNVDFGSTWVNPSFDTIEEVQVVGVGTSAEYGDYMGATVNVVTKSGTNQYHGSASYFFTNDSLQSDNSGGVVDLKPEQNDYTNDIALTFGGPIVKDKLLFFGSYGLNTYAVAPFDSQFFNEFRQNHVQVRTDWLVNKNNNVSGMFNTDPANDGNLGLQAGSGPEIAFDEDFRTDTYFANWNNTLNDRTLLEAKVAGFTGHYDRNPIASTDIPAVSDFTTGKKYGSFGFVTQQKNKRDTVTGNVTHYVDNFLSASHSFKFGAEYENASTRSDKDQTGGATFFVYGYGPYTIILGLTGYNEHTNASVKKFSTFVQDDVRVNNHATLNLGVRYDRPYMSDLNGDYRLATFNFLSPRLGFSYDIKADGHHVTHFHYGRYYNKINTYGPIGYAGTGYANPIDYYFFLTPGPFDPTDDTLLASVLQPQNLFQSFTLGSIPVDPNLTGPHTDVWNAGYETMINDNLALSFDYIYKRDRDFIIQTDRNQHTFEPFQYTNPFTNTTKTLFRRTDSLPQDFILSNDPFYFRNHQLAIVTLRTRQTARWSMESSLTYQRSRGTIDNDAGAAWSVGGFSYHTDPNFTQDPFYEGLLSFDRTWQFKFLTYYEFPRQFRASADYRWLSGRPWTPVTESNLIPELQANSFFEVFLEPRGNRRFAASNVLNLRLSKVFHIGGLGSQGSDLEGIIDIFNVFNDDAPDDIENQVFAKYPIAGTPSFGLPRKLIQGRRLRLGARFTF